MSTTIDLSEDFTPDLCDAYPDQIQILPPIFKNYGLSPRFYGPVTTVRCFEDNSLVKQTLNEPGEGRVLVVDGEGSLRKALLGDQIAAAAVANGWVGVVINGAIRDVSLIEQMQIGVRALGSIPLKTEKLGRGELNVSVDIGGVAIEPNDYLYADQTGVLVSKELLI